MRTHSFPLLIHGLAEKHHGGCLLTMSQKTDVPYTTLWRWERGMARTYNYSIVHKLAEYYRLSDDTIWRLTRRDAERRARGERVPIPDLGPRRQGPGPRARTTSRRPRA